MWLQFLPLSSSSKFGPESLQSEVEVLWDFWPLARLFFRHDFLSKHLGSCYVMMKPKQYVRLPPRVA